MRNSAGSFDWGLRSTIAIFRLVGKPIKIQQPDKCNITNHNKCIISERWDLWAIQTSNREMHSSLGPGEISLWRWQQWVGSSKGEITDRKNSPGRGNKVGKVLGKWVGQEHGTAGRRKCIWYTQSQVEKSVRWSQGESQSLSILDWAGEF